MQKAEENFKPLIEASPEGIFICNATGKILYVNESFCTILGYHKFELLNKSIQQFLVSDYEKELFTIFEGNTPVMEILLKSKNGTEIWGELSSATIAWNKETATVAFIRNINEHKKEKDDLIESNRRLQEYAFITSHKLRHPLANILGLVKLISPEDYENLENKQIIENLILSSNQLNDAVHELNAKLTSHKLLDKTYYYRKNNRNKKIALIDDDIINNYINLTLLKKFDPEIEVHDFISGEKALAFLKEEQHLPDIILLDLTMPVMDGWMFLDKFVELGLSNTIELYILTTSFDQRNRDRMNAYNLNIEFISKPLSFEWLNQILNKNQLHLFKG